MAITPNLGLSIQVGGTTPGASNNTTPNTYPYEVAGNWGLIDSLVYSANNPVPIPAGVIVSGNLDFGGFNLTGIATLSAITGNFTNFNISNLLANTITNSTANTGISITGAALATGVGLTINNSTALTSGHIVNFENDGTLKSYIDSDGNFSGGAVPFGSAGGDLSGDYPDPTVVALQGIPVASGTPTNAYVLTYNSGAGHWAAAVSAGGGSAGGDLTGSYPNPTIANLQGNPVSASGTPTSGYVLTWNGSAWIPASVGSSSSPTGPAGGDLGGSYPNPEVVSALNDALEFVSVTEGVGVEVVTASAPLLLMGNKPEAGGVGQVIIDNVTAAVSGKILSIRSGGTEKAYVGYGGAAGFVESVTAPAGYLDNIYTATPNGVLSLLPAIANGAGNAVIINNSQALSTAGDTLLSLQNDGTVAATFDYAGNLNLGAPSGTTTLSPGIFFNGASASTAHQSSIIENGAGFMVYNAHSTAHTFEINTTVAMSLTPTVLKLENGVLGINQNQATTALTLNGNPAPTGVSIILGTGSTSMTAGGNIVQFGNDGIIVSYIDYLGNFSGNAATATGAPPTGTASGDLSGSYPDPTVAKLQGYAVANTAPTNDYVLTYNSSAGHWAPAAAAGGAPSGSAGGDLAGSYPNPTINTIHLGNLNLGASGGTANLAPALYFNAAGSSTAFQSSIQATTPSGSGNGLVLTGNSNSGASDVTIVGTSASASIFSIIDLNGNVDFQFSNGGVGSVLTVGSLTNDNTARINFKSQYYASGGTASILMQEYGELVITAGTPAAGTGGTPIVLDSTNTITAGSVHSFRSGGNAMLDVSHAGHLIPNAGGFFASVPTVGTFATNFGTTTGAITGSDLAGIITFTTGTATTIAANTALCVVTLSNAYASTEFAVLVALAQAAGALDVTGYYAVPGGSGASFTIYNTLAITPASTTSYKLQYMTFGAGAAT